MAKPDCIPSAIFVAAFLATERTLDHRARGLVISKAPPFDIHSPAEINEVLPKLFRGSGIELPRKPGSSIKRIEEARATAERWLGQGVFVVDPDSIKSPHSGVHDLPPILFAWGHRELLDGHAVSILNSRTPRHVTPRDSWILSTKRLFNKAVENGASVVSSFGSLSYALVCRMACVNGLPQIVVCDDVLPFMGTGSEQEEFRSDYEDLFRLDRTLFLSPFPPGSLPQPGERFLERDLLVAALSWEICVGEVRPGGNMESVLKKAAQRNVRITSLTQVSPEESAAENSCHARRCFYGPIGTKVLQITTITPEGRDELCNSSAIHEDGILALEQWPERGSCLVHYTRSCPGPWPGQSLGRYCQSLIDARETAGHSGFDTLFRILDERLIRASARLTRGNVPVVSFTECLPDELESLIKWRPGLIRWSFEAYGIAIQKEARLNPPAVPVVYGDETVYQELPMNRKYLFQLLKSGGKDWSAEREWRFAGDLRLDTVSRDKVTVIVTNLDEARIISDRFGYRVTLSGIEATRGGVKKTRRNPERSGH